MKIDLQEEFFSRLFYCDYDIVCTNGKVRRNVTLLATQAYQKIIREVTRIGQTEVEDQRMLYLYKEKLVTKHREFLIENVMDMSYRRVGESGGLLYIHTISGVFSYTVTTNPSEFIHIFKETFAK